MYTPLLYHISNLLPQYSKSTRAKCHGPPPCKDSYLRVGTLRYGSTVAKEFGETVEWRHWGCVTPSILEQLALATVNNITGFQELKPSDQQKIRLAISLRRIDPADIPVTAKATTTSSMPTPATRSVLSQKRKANDAPSSLKYISTPSSLQMPEEEVEEESTEEEPKDEIYCTLNTSVVGIQYYEGLVGPGEEVLLVREPHNKYDRNAIQVKNIGHTQVGHLPRQVASKLAPLLDRHAVTVEGIINDGNLSGSRSYTLSITLKIYGSSDQRAQLEPQLIWATPGQRGFSHTAATMAPAAFVTAGHIGPLSNSSALSSSAGPSQRTPARSAAQIEAARKQQEALQKAAELKQMLTSLEKVDDEGRRSSLLDALCSTDDVLNLPLHPDPPGIKNGDLTVDLLKHQSQALQWCVEREYPVLPKKETDKPVQFWQMRKNGSKPYYYNIATKTPQQEPPVLGRGALCADAMGKTLTMLALILATKKDVPPDFSKSTLIVAPLSVLSNWEKQIADHCAQRALSTYVYYGNKRSLSAAELQKFDIVITTYQTVTGEHPNGNSAGQVKKKKTERNLFDVQWKRIILDEGHSIRNMKTKMAQAVLGLKAQRRWVLSGTPIDLGSILTFLRICKPLDDEGFYKRLLLRPLKNGEASGAELLRALMSHICIRRTKEMQDSNGNSLIPLPPVEFIKVPVSLNAETRQLYDEVEQVSKQRFENFMNRGATSVIQSNVLSMLTRMRQIALHPDMVPPNYLEQLRAAEANDDIPARVKPLSADSKLHLQGLLAQAIEDCEECPICFCILNEARITSCAHMFCLACITEVISRDPKCPMDRRPLTMSDLYEPPPPTDLTQNPLRLEEDEASSTRTGSSAKIDQLVHLLKLTPHTEKSLVFSQFTSFLDKIGETLEAEGISYVRFDGQMSAKRRQETITRFSVPLDEELPQSKEGQPTLTKKKRSMRPITDDGLEANENDDSDYIPEDNDDFMDNDFMEDFPFADTGKGKARSSNEKTVAGSSSKNENPQVMLISLKAVFNFEVANNVYLWWQEGIESQAVDRVNRIGQKKSVHVYQLIAENTVESKVLSIQERKKQLVQQAFSGIKRTETQRQQREARLQDLVELFGIRRQTASQEDS
ncbi:SNF2 family N-terminal domain-containing protein [Crucibulum laeve]|uniref:SNF2 family N-terminal domain-containing protein n=1 Tax=Crucibulum laeve TaxID=68775 RepID=A0A5C3MI22_9AGAR|nr:SNF2 family N-terminal domain-containing protein [Crucibulum laeve]